MTIILSIFLFLAIFGTTAFAVLFFRANLISQKAEEEARAAMEEAKKIEEAYIKIKNAPKVVLEKATLEAYRLEETAKAKGKELINLANSEKNIILEAAKVQSLDLINQANQVKEEALEQAKQISSDANKKVKSFKMDPKCKFKK